MEEQQGEGGEVGEGEQEATEAATGEKGQKRFEAPLGSWNVDVSTAYTYNMLW